MHLLLAVVSSLLFGVNFTWAIDLDCVSISSLERLYLEVSKLVLTMTGKLFNLDIFSDVEICICLGAILLY